MAFLQLIEFQTDRIKEFDAIIDAWLKETAGQRTATKATRTRDRDNDEMYVHIVEFPSYEAAMENSNRPETAKFAEKLAALCNAAPTFRNLDVERVDENI